MNELPDALPFGQARGRGAGLNPGNRFERVSLSVDGDVLDEALDEAPEGRQVRTEPLADSTRSIINRVDSPDLPFHWTVNPYRGCETGCTYCYARPTHEMLGFSCGLDFETRIMVKHDAATLLRRELAAPRWRGEPIVMSGVTDCYQPLERTLEVTRACLQVMAECCQPVTVVTKHRLVTRDVDLLGELARHQAANVAISLTTLDPHLAASMEPRASTPSRRLRAISELSSAGIPVIVMIAPVIPALNDTEVPALLQAASDAGARAASWTLLRLPHQVKAIFLEWLQRYAPDRAAHVIAQIEAARDGRLNDATFGKRMRGSGHRAAQIKQTFQVFARRHGLDQPVPQLSSASFRRPALDGQLDLFNTQTA